jgi:hypothetical protein
MIQKMPSQQSGLGRLVLSGQNPIDGVSSHGYTETALVAPDQQQNLLSQSSSNNETVDVKLLASYEEIARLKEQTIELKKKFYESTKQFYDASVRIQQLEHELAQHSTVPAESASGATDKPNTKN